MSTANSSSAARSSFFDPILTKRRFLTRRSITRACLALGAAAGLSLFTWTGAEQAGGDGLAQAERPEAGEKARANPLPVQAEQVRTVTSIQTEVFYTGEVRSRRTTELGFDVGGRIEQLEVREGDRILSGHPLARLDARRLQAQRAELLARQAEHEARLE